ncbi:MAG TPA: phosphonate C-P lyase system protein PhnH [Candidatus Dormibacteraeota bacterium]|jgi:alpha-D-ribose 1-methylphosphonate 5-triphosphate synthase subunit PhnH|nr:phosphonate C-P lyase system protein PhnH [Candidatus Dormibacteraeota bacterium]
MDEQTAHRAFRALLLANSYPGRVQAGPAASAPAVLEALREAVWMDAPQEPLIMPDDASNLLEGAGRGTELEPERGATLIRLVRVDASRVRVVLEGPGVDGRIRAWLPLSPAELAARDRACAAYPLGVDLVFLEPDGGIAALPRTTRVAMLEEV